MVVLSLTSVSKFDSPTSESPNDEESQVGTEAGFFFGFLET